MLLLLPVLATAAACAADADADARPCCVGVCCCYLLCPPNPSGTPSQEAARLPLCVMAAVRGARPNSPLAPTVVIATGEPVAFSHS
jgi:hypothetical protein